jgi:hypothetical protein
MEFMIRFCRTAFLVLCSLLPSISTLLNYREGKKNTPTSDTHGTISTAATRFPEFLREPEGSVGTDGSLKILIPLVFPLAAPFLLYRLKRTGFSGCRVTVIDGGLLVTARR